MTEIRFRVFNLLSLSLALYSICAMAYAQDEHLAAYWSFDEGKGNTTEDLSGNGNNATIAGQFDWVEV